MIADVQNPFRMGVSISMSQHYFNSLIIVSHAKRIILASLGVICLFCLSETTRADGKDAKGDSSSSWVAASRDSSGGWHGKAFKKTPKETGTVLRKSSPAGVPEIKNVIFMIGDGMGLATACAAMTVSLHPLNLETPTVVGLQRTSSADNYITDSAAAGTAIATGKKTKNGVIGLDARGKRAKSILEMAKEHGLATGLVVVTSITDATPASFVAHVSSRTNNEAIALDILKSDVDVFIGGGLDYFAKRADKLNLVDQLVAKGYEVDTTLEGIRKSKASKLAGLLAPVHCPYRLKGRGDMLPVSSARALKILHRNPNGFFLMIEGSHIDHGGHDNNTAVLVDEVLDFDNALGVALDFARADGHTLVIVTADHETGGVTLVGGNLKSHQAKLAYSTKGHTASMVPVYAFGPGSEKFSGIYENTAMIGKLQAIYGFAP